ncbi:MAG: Unknown protein [uncultured Aureispira sp.]|jgi:hypothetical protein|uniref:Lipoprotein n=1 Tax=uncultured Aureispira sp. TaxID=1331704 RepID=A0A6S6SSL4_9BACT|nr:MAG: Unknown protein [uncultured Aureispira sp.]
MGIKEISIKNFKALGLCILGTVLSVSCSDISESRSDEITNYHLLRSDSELVSNTSEQTENEKWVPYENRKVKGASGTEIHREDGKIRQIFTSVSKRTLENKKTRDQLFSDFTTVYKIERGESIFIFVSPSAAQDAYLNDIYNGRTWKSDYLGRYQVGADHYIKLPHLEEEEVVVDLSAQAQLQLANM